MIRSGMQYRELLPDGCPPPEAEEIAAERTVFRLVRSDPPTDADFRSKRAEKPSAVFGVSECVARGLSVFGEVRDCDKARKLPALKGSLVCRVRLCAGAGRIQQTGATLSHHTWWPWAAFNILPQCQVESR